jgi:hypothetical protein
MHLFIWILATLCMALWSALSWGFYKLLSMDPNWASDARGVVERLPGGEAIDRWFPGWRDLAQFALELSAQAIGWIGTAAPLVTGVLWFIGAVLIVGAAVLCSLIVWLLRDKKPPPPSAQAAA